MASVAIATLTAPALAQQAAPPAGAPEASDNSDEVIIVTGTHIARPQIESAVPVAVVSATSIQDAGQTNVLDALRDLPIAGQSLGTSASNFQNSGNGEATVNLRNLGSSRTLVLINGRRSVGVPGTSAVDLNNIPTDLIDHVEVVTGGASAIYGSDAIAGVVNILLKKDYNGIQLRAQDTISSRADGRTPLFSVLAGKSFSDDRGNITANFTYTKENGVPSSARAYSRNDSPTGSAYTPQGAFFDAAGDGFTFDPANNVVPFTGAPDQRYNRASQRLLSVPVERYIGSVLGHYDFSPAVQLYGEFTYSKTKASGHIEALAVDDQHSPGQSVLNFDGSNTYPGISSDSPYVPPAIAAAAGPGTFLDFFKRTTGIFDRSPHDKRDFYRGVVGVKGDIGSGWHYDLSYEHSQVRDNTFNQAIMLTNLGASFQATTLNGQIVCADPAARAAGCVPINPFGHQAYTPAQLKWLSTYAGGAPVPGAAIGDQVLANFLQKNWQDVVSLDLNGSLFDLPGGPLGVAIGGEYHREKVSEVFDPFTQSGFSSQQQNGNEFGKYNSKELYAEISAPILRDRPGIYRVELDAAGRYSHYSTVGTVWTYKYGGSYAPTPDISFRAMFARAVRAPNLNELYSPQANTAQQITDPCDQRSGGGETAPIVPLPAGCTAIPGIANYLQTHQNFAYTLAQVQTIFGFTGGNPNLKAEATNTFTAGATLTPRFLRHFYLTADYYSIKVKNAVASIDPQISVTQCFQTGSPNFCSLVHRNANGFITEVDQVNINAASYKVAGIDVQANYFFNTHFLDEGRVDLDLYYNHKFKQQQTPFAGGVVSNELGTADTYASQQLGTGFKDQFTFNANWAIGPVTLHYRLKYMGPVSASSGAYHIPAYTYHDLQVRFDVDKRFEFYAGVNNLLDKQPPFIAAGNSQWPGTNTVADTYDLLGRMLYAGVTVKF